jgi:hypothetical protein
MLKTLWLFRQVIISVLILLPFSTGWAESSKPAAGYVVRVSGIPYAVDNELKRYLLQNDKVFEGDSLVVPQFSKLLVNLNNKILIDLGGGAEAVIDSFQLKMKKKSGKIDLNLAQGSFRIVTNPGINHEELSFLLKTPTVTVGIRGTDFWGDVRPEYDRRTKKDKKILEFICVKRVLKQSLNTE